MKRFCLALLTGSVLAFSGLTACSASYSPNKMSTEMSEASLEADAGAVFESESAVVAQVSRAPGEAPAAPTDEALPAAEQVAAKPQLIKRAHLTLKVASVDESFEQVRAIVAAKQGDVISMEDYGKRQRNVVFELRVPQGRLDSALDALTELGDVSNRSISSEDVSNQLVDLQARLANARKSEEALQEIMSRSGDIADVLEVSRELSNVRQSIEQMAAVQKSLQNQVRYSTINLSLSSAVALSPETPSFTSQLSSSWNSATHSVGNFTTDLLQLGLWLLAYSPYLLILVTGGLLVQKMRSSAQAK